MWEIPLPAEKPLASQEGLCCMELVAYYYVCYNQKYLFVARDVFTFFLAVICSS